MRKTWGTLLACLMIGGALAGCGSPAATQAPTTAPTTTGTQTPARTDGSETSKGNIKVVGSTSVGPLMEGLKEKFNETYKDIVIDVEQVGSGPGIKAAQDGSADIGMASRALKDEEKPLVEYTLCLDGIAVVVHSDNKVKELTSEQIKKIYTGEITDWSELGGEAGKINLVTRESTSGTRGAFEELVLGEDKIDDKICVVQNSNGNVAQAVESDKRAIGYISLGIVKNYNLAAVKVDGVEATVENVQNDSYKLSRPFLLLCKEEPTGIVKTFVDFLMNDEAAKAYIEEKAYILK